MSCAFTYSGIASECLDNIGGIKAVYIGNHADIIITPSETGAATVELATGGNALKRYNMRRLVSSMTSTYNVDQAAGTSYFQTDLTLVFNKMSATKWVEIKAVSKGELAVIVEDSNGVFYVLGTDYPVSASAGTSQTGTALADQNGYNITLTDMSNDLPYTVADPSGVIEE